MILNLIDTNGQVYTLELESHPEDIRVIMDHFTRPWVVADDANPVAMQAVNTKEPSR